MKVGDGNCREAGEQNMETDGDIDTERALELATVKEYADLIVDIAGQPSGAPSLEELAYTNPALDRATIEQRLSVLATIGVVTERPVKQEIQCREPPEAWCKISDQARDLFDNEDIFPTGAWRREYSAITKTDRIETLEQLSR